MRESNMMSYTRPDARSRLYQTSSRPAKDADYFTTASTKPVLSPIGTIDRRPVETPGSHRRSAANTLHSDRRCPDLRSILNPTDDEDDFYGAATTAPAAAAVATDTAGPKLPSLNELLASQVLVAPGSLLPPLGTVDHRHYSTLRKDSVSSSSDTGSPPLHALPTAASSLSPLSEAPPELASSSSSCSSSFFHNLSLRPGSGQELHYSSSPSESAAVFGKDGNFQPIRTRVAAASADSSASSSSSEGSNRLCWMPSAALYADPEFKPSGAGYTAEYEGVKVVPGFGNYHVYKGGFCIPTHIDGEAVNPVWGLTKSKNPRKRLPIACGWCRRKKIRCEPSSEGCLQCKKARRQCEIEPIRRRLVKDSSFREYVVS